MQQNSWKQVRVRWEDISCHEGWKDVPEEVDSFQTILIDTLGYLLVNDGKRVVVTPNLSDHGKASGVMVIPPSNVREIVGVSDGRKIRVKR